MLSRFGLKTKLILSYLALAAIVLLMGLLSTHGLRQTSERYGHVASVNLPKASLLNSMRGLTREALTRVFQLTLPTVDAKEAERVTKKLREALAEYDRQEKEYLETQFVEGEKALYDEVRGHWTKVLPYLETSIALAQSRNPADYLKYAEMYQGPYQKDRIAYYKAMDELLKFQGTEATHWEASAKETAQFSMYMAWALTGGGFLLSLTLGLFISSSLSKSLQGLATQISNGSDHVSKASQDLSSFSANLSSSVTQQASALQQTSASIVEVAAMVDRSAENAMRSTDLSKASETTALDGQKAIQEMIAAMDQINDSNTKVCEAFEANQKSLDNVVRVIESINEKTKVINDIVFQTRLLSFNASVEAARSGEAGKGFAVVAEEVGNLAQMSGSAAREIAALIGESLQSVQSMSNEMKSKSDLIVREGSQKVEQGRNIADRCSQVFSAIVSNAGEVHRQVDEISSASGEQTKGIGEIRNAIGHLEQATQMNSETARQTHSSSEDLEAQVHELRATVSSLLTIVHGDSKAQQERRAA